MKERILVADDDAAAVSENLTSLLTRWGHEVESATDASQALERTLAFQPSVVIADLFMSGLGGLEFLRSVHEELPTTPVIVLTGHGTIEHAVAAMKEGAFDYLTKPVDPKGLKAILEKALAKAVDVREGSGLRRQLADGRGVGHLLGVSEEMQEVYRMVEMAASTSAPVMISGETGTGKELVARTIHDFSERGKHPFVAVNCSAVPETLLESELFGYEKGAFTGALARRAGYFELANGGTIFLDEIAEMSSGLQAKYLRPLQEGKVRRLGGSGEVKVDVRVMAATNQNVAQAMRDGTFRDDLYYRINVLNIPMPPLRRRPEDIPGLVEAFVAEANQKYNRQVESVDDSAMKRLREHSWPGNVRELKNVIERAVIATPNGTITAQCLFLSPGCKTRSDDQRTDVVLPLGTTLEASERELIVKTLASLNGNKTRAAHVLGVSVKTLHNKLRRWRLT
jgi:DNA-binding NtrC family response regulator